jgi:hypothetical protein
VLLRTIAEAGGDLFHPEREAIPGQQVAQEGTATSPGAEAAERRYEVGEPVEVEEEAVEMNSTARRWKSGLTMAGRSYVKGGRLSKGKPLTCAAL